jgi:hypothetical protein
MGPTKYVHVSSRVAPFGVTAVTSPPFSLTKNSVAAEYTKWCPASLRPNPAALRKAQHEVAEFHRFQKLGEDLVSINERICALRPVEKQRGGWSDQEKKRLLQSIRKLRGK